MLNTSSNEGCNPSDPGFVCSNCKTNVIICNLKNNNIQTKDLKNEEFVTENDDDPLGDIHSICFILNLLNYNPSFLQYLL